MNVAKLEQQYDKACNALFRAEQAIREADLAKTRAQAAWHTEKENCDALYEKLCLVRDLENENGC